MLRAGIVAVEAIQTFRSHPFRPLCSDRPALTLPAAATTVVAALANRSLQEGKTGQQAQEGPQGAEVFAPEAGLPEVEGQKGKEEQADGGPLEKKRLRKGEDTPFQQLVNDLGATADQGDMPLIQHGEDGAEGVTQERINTQGQGTDEEGQGIEKPGRLDS